MKMDEIQNNAVLIIDPENTECMPMNSRKVPTVIKSFFDEEKYGSLKGRSKKESIHWQLIRYIFQTCPLHNL